MAWDLLKQNTGDSCLSQNKSGNPTVKFFAQRAGLPGNVNIIYIVYIMPLDPAYPAYGGGTSLATKKGFAPARD